MEKDRKYLNLVGKGETAGVGNDQLLDTMCEI